MSRRIARDERAFAPSATVALSVVAPALTLALVLTVACAPAPTSGAPSPTTPAQTPAPPPQDASARDERVRIVYDAYSFPHVFADTDAGAFFGLGYQQALDFPVGTLANLWSCTGRYAEVAGPSVLARDERARRYGIDERARRMLADDALLSPDVRALLAAYVEGVERGRRWWLEHPDALAALAGKGGTAMHFDPVPTWLDPLATPGDVAARLRRLFEVEVELEHVVSFGIAMGGGTRFSTGGYSPFTNVWTVRNPREDASMLTLVDSHQPIKSGRARAYLVQVRGATYDVAGYTYAGFPCLVLGFNETLSFSMQTLPRPPRKLEEMGDVPFRFRGAAPVTEATWSARLEPDDPPRLRVGDDEVELVARTVTLRAWDTDAGELVEDPRGPLTFRFVPDSLGTDGPPTLFHPVTSPAPDARLAAGAARAIEFEGSSFLAARLPWEFWIRVGMAREVGGGAGGVDEVFDDTLLSFGRGEAFQVADASGGLEYVWMSLVPIPGEKALVERPWRALAPSSLDGNDPRSRWRGLHRLDALPRITDTGYDDEVEAWLNCNASPHELRSDGFDDSAFAERDYVMERTRWKTQRQDRARELVDAAAADGVVTLEELEACALDVQDGWSRRMWALLRALPADALSADARRFLDWVDAFRFEDEDGRPGGEAFLAHPMSQVAVFLSLLRDAYEARVVAFDAPTAAELSIGFDPVTPHPDLEVFASAEAWSRVRGALAASIEETAALFVASVSDAPDARGLANRAFLSRYAERLAGAVPLDAWKRLLAPRNDEAWGEDAPRVASRWGLTHLMVLTPHARRGLRDELYERGLASMLAPETLRAFPYHGEARATVLPLRGATDSIFQGHSNAFHWNQDALHATDDGPLYVLPLDFGSQILYAVEHRPGGAPRARFLAAMGGTELTRAIPGTGLEGDEHVRPAADFAAGRWNDFPLDEAALATDARRRIDLLRATRAR